MGLVAALHVYTVHMSTCAGAYATCTLISHFAATEAGVVSVLVTK